jgi:2-polyprenyl-6-methoxyphenol hydroxylase-like FAD-dependent oxidoreductase
LTQNVVIEWNKRLKHYEEKDDHVIAYFEDGTTATADFLVGADGGKSSVRSQRCPSLVREDTNITSIGGWLPMPPATTIPKLYPLVAKSLVRIFGPTPNGFSGLSFQFKNDQNEDCLLWGITHPTAPQFRNNAPKQQEQKEYPDDPVLVRKILAESNVSEELSKVIMMTPPENIFSVGHVHSMRPVSGNPLAPSSRVTLLGDAAHAMTTHRGLGANTAINDAVDLAAAVQSPDWPSAVTKYEEKMFARGFNAVQGSLQSTNMIHMTGYVKPVMRNWMLWTVGCVIWVVTKVRALL